MLLLCHCDTRSDLIAKRCGEIPLRRPPAPFFPPGNLCPLILSNYFSQVRVKWKICSGKPNVVIAHAIISHLLQFKDMIDFKKRQEAFP